MKDMSKENSLLKTSTRIPLEVRGLAFLLREIELESTCFDDDICLISFTETDNTINRIESRKRRNTLKIGP